MGSNGWPLGDVDPFPAATPDPVNNAQYIKELYFKVQPDYDGRFTVPILWDKKTSTIVNNESSEIIRMFNYEFNDQLPADKAALDYYPESLRGEIDSLNAWVYDTVNSMCVFCADVRTKTLMTTYSHIDGVYKSGFATTQSAYEAAVVPLFESLDRLEKILDGKDYLIGDRLTEADIRLFVTIVRPFFIPLILPQLLTFSPFSFHRSASTPCT